MLITDTEEHETFWIFKPLSLLSSTDLIPLTCMTLDQKMNAVTRFLILITLLLLLFNVNNALIIFLSGLIIIILIYVIYYKIEMNTECFNNEIEIDNKSFVQSCYTNDVDLNNLLSLEYKPPFIHNLRFNDPPPFIAPSHDLENWKVSSLTQHSHINGNKGGYSLKQSGYKSYNSSVACGINPPIYDCEDEKLPYRSCTIKKEYNCTGENNNKNVKMPCVKNNKHNEKNKIPVYSVENFENSETIPANEYSVKTCEEKCIKGVEGLNNKNSIKQCVALPGDLIEHCGYNPDKGCAGMPHNQPMSINDYYPTLAEYHKNINTQIIEPNRVYTQTEINEPQMTNLGISFAQQFQPLQTIKNGDEEIIIRKNPRLYSNPQKVYDYGEITPDSIYDPRTAGYGDERRTYIDTLTGQPRFYYDDINAGRECNFITRNNIDVYNFTNQVGIFDEKVNNNPLEIVKSQVHDAFINNVNDHRISMQESLMRKSNEMTRQRRMFPIQRDSRTRCMK